MKLGVMSALFASWKLEDVLKYIAELGLTAIELPVGCYPGSPFFDAAEMEASSQAQEELKAKLAHHGLSVSALAVHGNPVHPNPDHARADHEAFERAVRLAPRLGTDIVVTFSGCPGGTPQDRTPNWVTCAWPPDYQEILDYQWNSVLIPYWAKQATFAHQHDVRVAWEAHPGFSVYNPDTLIRLSQQACDKAGLASTPPLGANLDPSHFFWQGIDPVLAARALGEAGLLFYLHAKDTELDRYEGPLNGYNDARSYGDLKHRAWTFRTCGFGHGDEFWRPFLSMLRRYGYDGAISIEHEDPLMSVKEGFEKAVAYLKPMILMESADEAWWF